MYYSISKTTAVLGKVIQKPTRSFSFLSYLLRGEKNVLIDTVPEKAGAVFLSELKQLLPIQQLDAIILNHSEEDHSGALGLVLEENPKLPVYCTQACMKRLLTRYPNTNFVVVENLSSLNIGEFHFLFVHTPGLHWDDNMVTYFENDKTLFSNDLFGQYLGCEPPYDENYSLTQVLQGAGSYYEQVFATATQGQKSIIGKLMDLDLVNIAPGHGVILTANQNDVMLLYKAKCLIE